MKLQLKSLKKDEIITLTLKELFESYGYLQYKMSKFEEYAFYIDNKNFLRTEQIIAFSDSKGRLLALKPDITLSIAKSSQTNGDINEKLYYNESVYRYAKHNKEYKEMQQMGLEVIGNIDSYQTLEVVILALQSLQNIADDFVLDISHMGLIEGLFELLNISSDGIKEKLRSCITSKNFHDLTKIATNYGIDKQGIDYLSSIITCPTDIKSAINFWQDMAKNDTLKCAVADLKQLYDNLSNTPYIDNIKLDISIVNDTNYYNNIIFQGYIKNIPFAVLSGGRYDLLMAKFGKNIGAMGFALTLDELSRYFPLQKSAENEVIIIYDSNTPTSKILDTVNKQRGKNLTAKAVSKDSFLAMTNANAPSPQNNAVVIDLTQKGRNNV